MQVFVEPRAYHAKFKEFFARAQMDLGHEPEMISALDEDWYSILVVDGARALAHAIAPKPIGRTGLNDVEPLMGYGGLLTSTADRSFLGDALAAYSVACRELKVVAELIRFDPLLLNHTDFLGRREINIVPAKDVVVVSCENDREAQISRFSAPCRRRLRRGLEKFHTRLLEKPREVTLFRDFYERSLVRVGAAKHWFLPDRFYAAITASSLFQIYSVWSDAELAAAALVGHHPTGAHYVLAANAENYPAGAGERLIYEITRDAAGRGERRLMLGGGNTSDPDDPLLRYKSRYAEKPVTFFLGTMVHDRPRFDALQTQAVAARPQISEETFFLKHRLVAALGGNAETETVSDRR